MSDPKCARVMLEAAYRDILTLKGMSASVPEESFGFHVQQAAEKALKAWLALLGQRYPLTHNLYDLLELLATRGAATSFFQRIAEFTPYAVEFRYDGVPSDYELMDRHATLTLAEALVQRVRDQLAEIG